MGFTPLRIRPHKRNGTTHLHVEYAKERMKYVLLFRCGLLYEYSNLECVRIHGISRIHQAECGIHIRVVAL